MQMGYDFDHDRAVGAFAAEARARLSAGVAAAVTTVTEPERPVPLRQPEWVSLRSRFAAIHALRRALGPAATPAPVTGSFASAGESVLSAGQRGTVVNPVYWANIKAPSAITGAVAVPPHAATED